MFSEQLTTSQQEAVFHIDGPLLVIAGPGSGKTRVITYRIAALIEKGVRPYNICAITFTNKAAEEMRQRAITLGDSAGAHISTFHSLCVRILRQFSTQANIEHNFSIYDASDQIRCMKQAVKECELDTSNFSPARMLDAVSTLKNKLIDAETFATDADDFFSKMLVKIYTSYQRLLRERNALDFDDLLMKTAVLLRDNSNVCDELGNRFRYLLIDEYQDTNHAQYQIARSLALGHKNICATGDPDQSIYRWRGADIRNILAFENDWLDAKVVKLEENFRSTPNILEAADNLIAANKSRKQKVLIPTMSRGKDIDIRGFENERHEAQAVAEQIADLVTEGVALRDIAVFYRVNSMSRAIEEAMVKNQIPYQIVRGVEFYGRKEIRDLLAYLKLLVNQSDEIALLRIVNTPPRGIGKTTLNRVGAYANAHNITFLEALRRAVLIDSISKGPKAKIAAFVNMISRFAKDLNGKVGPLAERIFTESKLKDSLQATSRADDYALENVNELINAIRIYDEDSENPSVLDYLQQISLFSDADSYDNTEERTALMTLHAAKGLEFENVFIVGLEEGLLPHERSFDNKDELEEERRLLFVGITRAKSQLFISYARYRTVRGQTLRTIPSQFLYELGTGFAAQQSQQQEFSNEIATGYDDDISQVTPEFEKKQLVVHKKFGLGVVENFQDMGENSIVVVKFNSGQRKSLMVKYAKLAKLKNL